SGSRNAALGTPKLGVVLGPWARTEFYVNGGNGFHSNHANGVLQRVDPTDQLVTPTAPIARTRGAGGGFRTVAMPRLQTALSMWIIDSDSELVYAPEDGFTEPSRPGRRYGIESNSVYRFRRWLALDLDAAWSQARYRIDPNHEGRDIPDAIRGVI